jgi:regulator of sigma E protease
VGYLFAFVGIALLIVLHELGHFAAAKAVGMRVERFSLFFGKPIASVTRGETEYRIGVIPLGGYVRITGMNPYEELDPDVAHRAFLRQPAWKRITVIAAGPAVNLLVFLVLVFGLLWHQGQAHGSFSVGSIETKTPAAQQLKLGDQILSVDGRPAALSKPNDKQFDARTTAIAAVLAKHSCAPPRRLGCVATTPARVVVLREGQRKTLLIKPHFGEAGNGRRMLLGIGWNNWIEPIGPGKAASETLSTGWSATSQTVSRITGIFTSAEDRKQLSSVVGAGKITADQFVQDGFATALGTLALISLSLALINLFPFLPLDGGHIAWAVVEKIRGRPVPFRAIERASAVGFVLIAFVFIIGLSNDIGHLTGDGFGVRNR